MKELKDLYNQNVNIMKHLRDKNDTSANDLSAILHAYDLQAGTYTDDYYNNESSNLYMDGQKVTMTLKEFYQEKGRRISEIIDQHHYSSILEVGVGEATSLCDVILNLKNKQARISGVDISLSRISVGNQFLEENGIDHVELIAGDMFQLPFADNAFDIVFTNHCIEPNTTRAMDAIQELYRITNRYLILIEPTYQLGNEETKHRIDEHKYCKEIITTIEALNLKVLEHRLFEIGSYNNQSSIIIVEKDDPLNITNEEYHCPVCKNTLLYDHINYFCSPCSTVYPVIKGTPCLTPKFGILFNRYAEVKR
ncbi:MAG: class I SAM-dependent methyltransferase [Paenibacillaceae bacterium]